VRKGLHKRLLFVAALIAAGSFVVLSELTLCPFANVTGHPCPGCGMTRAVIALLQGHVRDALGWHPLVLVFVPVIALVAIDGLGSYLLGRNLRWSERALRLTRLPENWLWATLAAGLLVVWVARFCGQLGGPVSVQSEVSSFIDLSVALRR
jgi:hypothetical protein